MTVRALEYMEWVAAECCPYVSRLIYGILGWQAYLFHDYTPSTWFTLGTPQKDEVILVGHDTLFDDGMAELGNW